MTILFHPDRAKADNDYKAALADARKAETISEEAWDAANQKLELARRHLVEMELKWPTKKEVRAESNHLYLANRGLA